MEKTFIQPSETAETIIDLLDDKIMLNQYGVLIELPRWAEE